MRVASRLVRASLLFNLPKKTRLFKCFPVVCVVCSSGHFKLMRLLVHSLCMSQRNPLPITYNALMLHWLLSSADSQAVAVVAGGNLNSSSMHPICLLVGLDESPASTRSQYMAFEEFVVVIASLGCLGTMIPCCSLHGTCIASRQSK